MTATPIAPSPTRPTTLAGLFVRYVLGFGVWIGIGLAPFLGKVHVPGFDALLSLYPLSLQKIMIPFSAFLMGLIALGLQGFAEGKLEPTRLRRLFGFGLIALVVGLFSLVVLYMFFVVYVGFGDGGHGAVVVGPERATGCGCKPAMSDEECIQTLSLESKAIASCWRGPAVKLRQLLLTVAYLLLTGGFAALVAVLLLRRQAERQRSALPPGPSANEEPAPPPPPDPSSHQASGGGAAPSP